MNTAAPALEISGLTKSFGTMRALDEVDLVVESGTVHCVLGENGAGKSTLCHVVGGSLVPDGGGLRLYGSPYAPAGPPTPSPPGSPWCTSTSASYPP